MPDISTLEFNLIFLLSVLIGGWAIYRIGVQRGQRRERAIGLEEDERLFQQMIESAPVGVCIIRERKFAFVNETYFRMFGYEAADDVTGMFVEELYAEEERERQRQYARDRVAGKPVPTHYETIGLRQNGDRFEVSVWVSLIRYQGQLSSLGFVIDRSVEMEMRRKLDHTNRLEAIGTLAGGIAHDFNNILTAIMGYSELALLRSKDDGSLSSDLQHILQAGKRAKDLIRQIHSFSRYQKHSKQIVRLSSVIDEVLPLVRSILPGSVNMREEISSEASIMADTTSIHQLVMNLCVNAEHAMRKGGGTLTIGLSDYSGGHEVEKEYVGLSRGNYVLLTIKDTGGGIPADIKEKVYEPFFTTKEVGEGTGMGLSQVYAITTSHNGYVTFSENQPVGTVFSVLFPVVQGLQEPVKTKRMSPVVGSGRILLVDDEEMVLEVTERILCELGYDVVSCLKSGEALNMFLKTPDQFDLVLSDLNMPGIKGDELIEKMKGKRPDLPIVLCSGYSAAITDNSSIREMATILEKPVEKSILAETVSRLLNKN